MTDKIHIHDLHLRTIIGINPDERVNRQDVMINLTIEADTRAAAASEQIEDAVNYRSICKDVITMVEASSYLLLERLVEEVAKTVLSDRRVQSVTATVEKPGALRFARSVGITIHRTRQDVD